MMFFLLKWVFNAIKRDSSNDDPVFKGASFISRADLVKQLAKNVEVLQALGLSDQRQLQDRIKVYQSSKDGFYTWPEFVEFFMARDLKQHERSADGSEWWNQIDSQGRLIHNKEETENEF